jgi:dCTP deaminase
MLGKPDIRRLIAAGHITVDPLDERNIGSSQIDVSLGRHFYRDSGRTTYHDGSMDYFNPYDEEHVKRKWVLCEPIRHRDWADMNILSSSRRMKNIGLDEELIFVNPGETILAHTEEFIGASCDYVTSMMKARSSLGRNEITVCNDAGMGDVGYFTRWTFEIRNNSRSRVIVLPCGRRIGQILFFNVGKIDPEDVYSKSGKYQNKATLAELKAAWIPEEMLPKQHLDRESRAVRERLMGVL